MRIVGIMIVALSCLSAACAPTALKITPVPVNRTLKEYEIGRDHRFAHDKVAVIDVSGVIMNRHAGGMFSEGEHPVSLLVEKLDAARRDSKVKAVVLRINSPGGSVTASEIMHHELQRFRKRTEKPVIAMFMDVAASGGYYIACACDAIVAHPTTVTGSIGVIMQLVDVSSTMAKLGIVTEAIKSGPNKDAGSPFRPLQDSERDLFQGMIDSFYARFVDVVDHGRPKLSRDEVLKLADGRVYTAQQALEHGLVDQIGSLRRAIDLAKQKAGIERCRIVAYQRPLSWRPNIYAQHPDVNPGIDVTKITLFDIDWPSWLRPGGAQFMYLWQP